MTFQLLISSLNSDAENLIKTMNVKSDAIVINQCDRDGEEELCIEGNKIKVISRNERGVGRSRNLAIDNSTADIILFSDEDIIYKDGYEEAVLEAFETKKDASVLTFNFDVDERRRTYYNTDSHQITWKNYGRYPAYAIAVRRKDILDKGIKYSELFGGGAKYSNGEDSLFLHDCLKKGLVMYSETALLGMETYRESTWFKGYSDKFFFDRGVLYHFLYGKVAALFGLRFLVKNKSVMLKDISLMKAFSLLRKGIKEGKTL